MVIWPFRKLYFCLLISQEKQTKNFNLPGNSHCKLLGLPCEHGISVPQQSGWHRRGCRRFSVDSVLLGHYHCEIPSGRASGLSAFLEYYEWEQSSQCSSSHPHWLPPHHLTPATPSSEYGFQHTIGVGLLQFPVFFLSTMFLLCFFLTLSFPNPLRVLFLFY